MFFCFFFSFITSIFPSHITIHLICGSRNSSKWSELHLLNDPPFRHYFSRLPLLIHFWVKEFPEKTSFAFFKGSMISKHSTEMGSNYSSSSQIFQSLPFQTKECLVEFSRMIYSYSSQFKMMGASFSQLYGNSLNHSLLGFKVSFYSVRNFRAPDWHYYKD